MDVEALPEDFRELGEGLVYFMSMLKEVRDLAGALSRGDLSGKMPGPDNELAANLKALHATLKHLTWQTQQVAAGDYDQHIDFMGDFADAFNSMVTQLKERRDEVMAEMQTVQKQSQDLARSNSLFETITSRMSEWIVMINRETGEHLFANHPVQNDLANEIFESQLYKILLEYAEEINDEDEYKEAEFPLISDTAVQWFSVILYPVKWYEHNAVAAVLTDITEEKRRLKELEDVAYKDMLTGVYNRHFGMKLLNGWIEERKCFVIAFIDMDRLKYVNDVFGHAEGDRYILRVAELLKEFSPDPIVCRLGGDEFMVLGRDLAMQEAESRLDALRSKLATVDYANEDGSISYKCSMSFGVVEVPANNKTPASDLLSLADEKMYEYKKAHKAERRRLAPERTPASR